MLRSISHEMLSAAGMITQLFFPENSSHFIFLELATLLIILLIAIIVAMFVAGFLQHSK